MRKRLRWLTRAAIRMASVKAVLPSYIDAFDTSMPVSWHMRVWNSKIACSVPWVISAWYGV